MEREKIVRRLKTYTGGQGYVYQYYFVGQRAAIADDPEAPATEFIFDVTADRKSTYAVSVFLKESAVKEWAVKHGRALTEPEQYAAAKLRLFRAFDELDDVKAQGRRLAIDSELLAESLATLGIE
jgi:ubiquinone biosynthesis protein UbiJ